jgi:hypothetical protein
MTNQFHFEDFTRDNYRRLLRLARKHYVFRMFTDFSRDERFVLWRHDIDFSIHSGHRLATIEAEEGVRATYFLYMHSDFYNLFERAVVQQVRSIIALGHTIGLHFDTYFYGVTRETDIEAHLQWEKAILEDTFGQHVDVFSFHNTSAFTASCRRWNYAGMVNAYAKYFQDEVGYISDSNGYWRHRRLEDVLSATEDPRLQVLTHPAWWQDTPMAPRLRVERCINGRAAATRIAYDELLASAGRKNIGT